MFRRSSLYSRKSGVSGFWCHHVERSASPRRICAVTRGFQTATEDLSVFPLLPRHYHVTRMLLSPFITTVRTPVILAIINIIYRPLLKVDDDDDDDDDMAFDSCIWTKTW